MIDRWNAAVVDKKQVVAGGATYPSGGALTVKTYRARNDVETDVTLVGDQLMGDELVSAGAQRLAGPPRRVRRFSLG